MKSHLLQTILWCLAWFSWAVVPAIADAPKGPTSSAGQQWAFRPLKQVEPPADASGWSANPIDRFVRARLRRQSLEPAGPADKRTLLRRVTFDLIGLPPTPAAVDAFLADHAPDAFAKVV